MLMAEVLHKLGLHLELVIPLGPLQIRAAFLWSARWRLRPGQTVLRKPLQHMCPQDYTQGKLCETLNDTYTSRRAAD